MVALATDTLVCFIALTVQLVHKKGNKEIAKGLRLFVKSVRLLTDFEIGMRKDHGRLMKCLHVNCVFLVGFTKPHI